MSYSEQERLTHAHFIGKNVQQYNYNISKEVISMAEAPYASDIKYLSDKVTKEGSISSTNSIYQKLDGKRNVASVQAFLSTKIDPHLK